MLKRLQIPTFAALMLGGLLGYSVASGKLPIQQAQAATPVDSVHATTTPDARHSSSPTADCCDGLDKGTLLASAGELQETKKKGATQKAGSARKPNIVFIMGDDIGIWNIGAYHRGMMSGKTPNLDKLASQGVLFTDYYAEASCTAGRANFITGELPIRTGLTTVGQAGTTVGMPDEACTSAAVLRSMGYATGQFGKNHLGDLNRYLPTLHGFDEFHGYLYHLDALSDPYWFSYPKDPAFREKYGPRNVLHTWATDRMTPPKCRAGARSASRRSRTTALCRHTRRRA